MKKTLDAVCLGELLVDFTQAGFSETGMRLFEQNPGGAPANVAAALARLGAKAAFAGKVGADMHGAFLKETLAANNVDTSGLVMDGAVFTTLAFVSLAPNGERSFSFARKPGADTCLRPEEVPRALLESARLFHFGSLSLTCEPARSAALEALRIAKSAGAVISYDPNYRASLWPDEKSAVSMMKSVLPLTDCVKLSEEEAALLSGEKDYAKAAEAVLKDGPGCVVVTLGARGAAAFTRGNDAFAPAPAAPVVDTTGAGDAFWGAFLWKLLETGPDPSAFSRDALAACLIFANAAASCAVQKRGGIPSLPTRKEAEEKCV
ncbi:MAG: carbohydrate kinase [Treponema sp.]|jgi:fructokinase|nr:carbohydrate kinase [Treponema sp.]